MSRLQQAKLQALGAVVAGMGEETTQIVMAFVPAARRGQHRGHAAEERAVAGEVLQPV